MNEEEEPSAPVPGRKAIPEGEPARKLRRSRQVERSNISERLTPTDRIVGSFEAHIQSLEIRLDLIEQERRRLISESERARVESERRIDRLGEELNRLLPESAKLNEALGNLSANGVVTTAFVTLGAVGTGYAVYLPSPTSFQHSVASAGAALTIAGIVILVVTSIRGNRARP